MATTNIYTLQGIDGVVRYVGKTDYPKIRLRRHASPKNKNNHLRNWVNKVGGITLNVIDEVEKGEWKFWEQWYISLFKSWGFSLLNLSNGGDGTDGYKHTDDTRRKMKSMQRGFKKGENHPFYGGKNHPCLGKAGNMKGKRHKPETIERLRQLNVGENNPSFGRVTPNETRDLLRKNSPKSMKVEVDGILYDSLRDAANKLGMCRVKFTGNIKKGLRYQNGAWKAL